LESGGEVAAAVLVDDESFCAEAGRQGEGVGEAGQEGGFGGDLGPPGLGGDHGGLEDAGVCWLAGVRVDQVMSPPDADLPGALERRAGGGGALGELEGGRLAAVGVGDGDRPWAALG
jgi:hypothetical protein